MNKFEFVRNLIDVFSVINFQLLLSCNEKVGKLWITVVNQTIEKNNTLSL